MSMGVMGTCGDLMCLSVNFTPKVEYTSRFTFTATAVIECTISGELMSAMIPLKLCLTYQGEGGLDCIATVGDCGGLWLMK